MKTGKFSFNWQSFLLGAVLCAVLVVFIGSKVADPQSVQDARTLQRAATMTDIYNKTATVEAQIAALEEHLKVIEKKIEDTYNVVYYRLPK